MHHGQEIYIFFNIYGAKGLIGIIISISLIGFIVYRAFKIIIEKNIDNYEGFIKNIIPKELKKNRFLSPTVKNIVNIFLLISFNIMVAGFATYFLQEFDVPKWYGAILIATMCIITFSKSIDGVIKINTYLIPILIVLIAFLGIKKINSIEVLKIIESKKTSYWILSSMLYASYNSITLIPILISLKKYINTKKEARNGFYFYYYFNVYTNNSDIFFDEYIF